MTEVRLPRLLNADLTEAARLHPLSLPITEQLSPLSTAEMTLAAGERVQLHDLIELYTINGSAGVYRVTGLADMPGGVQEVSLTHGLHTLTDAIMPGEGEQSGSCRELMSAILACQLSPMWQLGSVDVPDDVELTWKYANSSGLESITGLMKELPDYCIDCDQTTVPWTVHIRAMIVEPICECRLDRNVVDYTITWDDSELCTRLYIPGSDIPVDASDEAIARWGIIARNLQADKALGDETLRQLARKHLDKYSWPLPVISVSAVDLSRETGQPVDRLRYGAVCRLILDPEHIYTQRIISCKHEDAVITPDDVTLTLCTAEPDTAAAIAGIVVDTKVIRTWMEAADKELEVLAERIRLLATVTQVDALATRVQQVEIDLNAAEAELLLKASATDVEEALIRLSGLESEILLKADKVDIEGFLTIDDNAVIAGMLAGSDITCNALTANESVWTEYISAYDTSTTSLTTDFFSFDGSSAEWKSTDVVTDIGTIAQEKRHLSLRLSDGSIADVDFVENVSITTHKATINYIGKS